MDKINRYREILRRVIEQYASYKPAYGQIETETIIDLAKNHYELMRVGWEGQGRVHGAVIHLDLIDGKVWIQYDGTNWPVAEELIAAGIPKEEIVLGFQPAHLRPLTGFAAG